MYYRYSYIIYFNFWLLLIRRNQKLFWKSVWWYRFNRNNKSILNKNLIYSVDNLSILYIVEWHLIILEMANTIINIISNYIKLAVAQGQNGLPGSWKTHGRLLTNVSIFTNLNTLPSIFITTYMKYSYSASYVQTESDVGNFVIMIY